MSERLVSPQEDERAFRIYLCGSYRDVLGDAREARQVLERLQESLRQNGFDAYTQRHPRASELAPGLSPAQTTRRLEELSDLVAYVGVPFGREGGWSSELSDAQARYPEGARKRVVLIRDDFPLSQVLSNEHEGHLSDPFVSVIAWSNEEELARVIGRLAVHLAEFGSLPEATKRKGRLRL
jgi:hypothetical protein